MAASKPTAINFKKELFWVTCNRCARQMNDIRMFLSSCKCLFCQQCLPKTVANNQCTLCKATNVAVKPIGKDLPLQARDMFRPLKDQRSLAMMVRKDAFKMRHVTRALLLHQKYRQHFKLQKNQREEKYKALRNEIEVLKKKLEEKKRQNSKMEEKIQTNVTINDPNDRKELERHRKLRGARLNGEKDSNGRDKKELPGKKALEETSRSEPIHLQEEVRSPFLSF